MKNLHFISKLFYLSLFFYLANHGIVAQKLSGSTKVSLITIAPGDELNDAFGHTLLYIYDPANGIDKAYNFGGYDYDTKDFYLKFVKGQLPYEMSYAPLEFYKVYYQKHNRKMTEQILSLALGQKQLLYNNLESTYNNPQTRNYMYKFYTDNCSTRIRDALMEACSDSMHLQNIPGANDSTYREWMNKCLLRKHHYWAAVGMNAGLGTPADERVMQINACYIPENLMKSMSVARRMASQHRLFYFVKSTKELFPTTEVDDKPLFLITPRFWFLVLLIFTFYRTFRHWKKRQKGYLFDKIFFGLVGLLGWVLLFLWFGTDHGVTNFNMNLLWAFPFHLPIIFWLSQDKAARDYWYGYYFILVGLMIIMGLIFVVQYSYDTVPLVLALFVRALYHAAFEREHRMTNTKFRKIIKGRHLEVIHLEHEQSLGEDIL